MVLITIPEIFDMLLMTAAVGYIFSDVFRKPADDNYDPLKHFSSFRGFDWNNLYYAAAITAPAIILHELAHKFAALSFGMQATFQAAYFFLFLGLMMKLMNFGFIFFVPAYVSIAGKGTALQFALTAGAGPFMNLILWLLALFLLKNNLLNRKYNPALLLTSKINMFLFVFNMLPIPGFDGSKFFLGLIQAFF